MADYIPSTLQFLLSSRQCELKSLNYLLESGELVGKVSTLIHHLQRERGAVNLFLCHKGHYSSSDLFDSEQNALRHQQQFLDHLHTSQLHSLTQPHMGKLFHSIARAIYALGVLQESRPAIAGREMPVDDAVEVFNDTIRHLLTLVFTITDTSADPTISRALIALFSLMQGKELAGQERAIGVRIFSDGEGAKKDKHLAQQIADLIERQEHYFSTFFEFSDELTQQRWSAIAPDLEFEQLRRVACTHGRMPRIREVSQHWFLLATQRMDAFKQLEDAVQHALMELCRQRMASTLHAFEAQQADIDQLKTTLGKGCDGYSVFMAHSLGEAPMHSGWLASDGVPPQLGQSLLTLLRGQAQRLEEQNQELIQLREVLEQRKIIDKAKNLLMAHRQLSENEAYTTLRQMAMDQNKKIVEIASALLSVAGIFHSAG